KGDDAALLGPTTDENRIAKQLDYVGRRSISKYGCSGCHDVPGFEDAKPIGTGLADWGRKDPSRLAFEHISHYLEHGHGKAKRHDDGPVKDETAFFGKNGDHGHAKAEHAAAHEDERPIYY